MNINRFKQVTVDMDDVKKHQVYLNNLDSQAILDIRYLAAVCGYRVIVR
ncbi:hypothetical protein [Paenibacillus xylanexedens]|nr:hypothetical protein [Paenibacillus xylanexedens]